MSSKTVGSTPSRFSSIKSLMREPLLQFLAAGFGLFVIFDGLQGTADNPHQQRIDVTADEVRHIEMAWLARWQRPLSDSQLQGLIDEYVKEEILYREALRLGLDKNDTIIRRRLAQKMDFLADDVAALRDPAPGVLEHWYANKREHYAPPLLVTFHHLFFASDKWGADAQRRARSAMAGLTGKTDGEGDVFMFQKAYAEQSRDQVARVFGSMFATTLFQQASGRWVGPIESGYGWHLVWVDALARPPAPPFETVAQQVKSDWLSEQRAAAKRSSFDALKARYDIVVTMPTATPEVAANQPEQP